MLVAALGLFASPASAEYLNNGGNWIVSGDNLYRYAYSTGYGMVPGFWYLYDDDPCWVWTPDARVWVCQARAPTRAEPSRRRAALRPRLPF